MLNDKKKAMIRVVSRPFLGKEKFKDFRLCYVDAIPETVFGLTPESKAWQRSAEYRVIKKKLEEEVMAMMLRCLRIMATIRRLLWMISIVGPWHGYLPGV